MNGISSMVVGLEPQINLQDILLPINRFLVPLEIPNFKLGNSDLIEESPLYGGRLAPEGPRTWHICTLISMGRRGPWGPSSGHLVVSLLSNKK